MCYSLCYFIIDKLIIIIIVLVVTIFSSQFLQSQDLKKTPTTEWVFGPYNQQAFDVRMPKEHLNYPIHLKCECCDWVGIYIFIIQKWQWQLELLKTLAAIGQSAHSVHRPED